MRILIIVGSFKTGGAERMGINTGEELLRRGYDVHYIVQRPIFEIPNSIPPERIRVLREQDKQNFLYKVRKLFIGVNKVAKDIDPDIVIAFSRFSSFLACFTLHKRIIARFDMNPFTLNRKQRFWANFVLNFPTVKKVVVPSSGMLRALKNSKKRHSNKFIVIPNSIKSEEVSNKAKDKIPKSLIFQRDYISAMGRLSHQKNFELLIKGFANSNIKEKYDLVIVGDGRLKEKLLHEVHKYSLEGRIIFTGQLKNPFPIIKNSKFFVNTSTRESFCNVILEALTLAKPVIATDCDYGPSDMIVNNENGFLIENRNLEELVERLNQFNANQELISRFSKKAEESSRKFQIKSIGDKWRDLVEMTVIN